MDMMMEIIVIAKNVD